MKLFQPRRNLFIHDETNIKVKEIQIDSINQVMIDGTSYYYIIDKEGKKYSVSIKINKNLIPFLKNEDKVTISYNKEKEVTEIIKLQ